MNSRERVIMTINHKQPDRIPIDLGATGQTGISASTLYGLRRALELPEKDIRVIEPYQILGDVEEDLRQAIGVDIVGLWTPVNFMGIRNERWKPWRMPDGTPTLMAGDFNYKTDSMGNTYVYPQGDISCEVSMKLPAGGYFFDSIDRAGSMDEDDLNAREHFKDSFSLISENDASLIEAESIRLYEETEYAVVGGFPGGGFGDVAALPGHFLKEVKGIRRLEDWLVAHMLYPEYITEVFEMQADAALKNLEIYRQAVGERIQVINISGTDFGTQSAEYISPELYRNLYKPFHKKINDWIHKHTNWKTFYHTCGSIVNLLDDFHDAGIDILNPVQCSAAGMDPEMLKKRYGDKFVFWGGAVDTQHTLPFGTPEAVAEQVKSRIQTFSPDGGFVFASIHNIVGKTPVDNLLAMYNTARVFR